MHICLKNLLYGELQKGKRSAGGQQKQRKDTLKISSTMTLTFGKN